MLSTRLRKQNEQGVVLIIALIVLISMTLAGIALMRSVDTSNLIAGNLAFQQAATHSADTGVETAVGWLENPGISLEASDETHGYAANGSDATNNPAAGQSWDDFWGRTLDARSIKVNGGQVDAAGNSVAYVVDRLCGFGGSVTSGAACVASPSVTPDPNSDQGTGIPLNSVAKIYYRITVRVAGPKSTVSYVQTVVAL